MITVIINGQSFDYPEVGDTDWGNAATIAFQSLVATTLQKSASSFTLENELDFGGANGIKVLFISSRSNDPALSGVFRLSNGELVAWRNGNNDDDNTVSFDASDNFVINGNTISFDSDGEMLVNGVQVTRSGEIVNADVADSAGIVETKLALDFSTQSLYDNIENHKADTANPHSVTKSQVLTGDLIVNSDVDASAAIEESKLDLDYGTSALNTNIENHKADTSNPHSVTKTQVLTGNPIVNSDVDASAAIAESKLALDYSTSSLNTAITSHTGNTNNPHSTSVSNLTDTTITSANSGDVLSYDGSKWVNSPSTSSSLSGLSDTDITTPANGDTLVYNSVSTKWENSDQLSTLDTTVSSHVGNTSNPHSTKVSNLDDTTLSGLNYGDRLTYDSNTSTWFNQPNTLGALLDTGISSEQNGDALVYDGVQWINQENSVNNLSNVNVSTPVDGDVLVYDSNDDDWKNSDVVSSHVSDTNNPHSTSVDNLTDSDVDSNTLTDQDILLYNDQTSKWENSQILVNHIGNTANPHLTTVSKLTDTSISSLADKQLLQYDLANLQWVNSSDVWSTIEVNDIANINNSATAVTLTVNDKRHQIFTATQGFDVKLPSTGVSAGEKFVFSFEPSSGDYYSTTSFCFKASDDSIINYAHNCKFDYIFTAKTNTPTTSTDWFFSWNLAKRMTLEGHMDAIVSSTANQPTAYKYNDRFTIFAGYWDVYFAGGVTPALVNTANIYSGIVLIYSDAGPVQSLTTSERIGVMQCVYVPRTSVDGSSFTINGTSYQSRTMLPTSMSSLAEVPYRSKAVTFFTRMVTVSSSASNQVTATAVANLVAPYTTSI